MSFRVALAATLLALGVGPFASAQIEDSGLELVNPWGMSFLEAGEPSLPTDMWRASDADDLLPLMRDVRTHDLTPAERTLMRRMALSPATPPSGIQEPHLRAERARIMYDLGEAEAAASLMARLDTPPPGMNADEIIADVNLALGNEATACAMLNDPDRLSGYWAKLRAVCAALEGNSAGAELAIEMALQQDAVDSWLLAAVFATSGELPEPPEADYSSGLNLAISAKAGLTPPVDPIPANRPDLSAAIAMHRNLPIELRVKAAHMATKSDMLATNDYRTLFLDMLSEPEFVPTTPLESALFAARDPLVTDEDRSFALAAALQEATDTPAHFDAVARLLWPEIARLPINSSTAASAAVFARASLAAGELETAQKWADANTMEGAPEDGSFDSAFMSALLILAGLDASRSEIAYAGVRLAAQAETDAQKRSAVRLFALWTAMGIAPPADARRMVVEAPDSDTSAAITPHLLRILGAAEADAAGEVILSTVGMTKGDPTALDNASLVLLLNALERIGAEDAAREMALEAAGYWKAS
ncbi:MULTISPECIES: hypothetical protein [Hyphomonas]|uniref:Antifreeze glycopeptide polyprotein n=1 Tax=Hyphomonas atlantica TaxID=1280948 RepID=A0A059E7J6_9PROT|nr:MULTISPECIES: hypothetical protein [Hyphomonas]KCZ63507.1 hypothetical protein HY36_14525 [Hyphomonas atlantica]MAM06144.1 hypothetical protein [Hyphomonas sp.]HAE93835.1 hypothetical protein [Hyphomonas atlantica]HBQ48890.1 hypothetical protein [Hyphomonas atlantica]